MSKKKKQEKWVRDHKILTTLGVLVYLIILLSALFQSKNIPSGENNTLPQSVGGDNAVNIKNINSK